LRLHGLFRVDIAVKNVHLSPIITPLLRLSAECGNGVPHPLFKPNEEVEISISNAKMLSQNRLVDGVELTPEEHHVERVSTSEEHLYGNVSIVEIQEIDEPSACIEFHFGESISVGPDGVNISLIDSIESEQSGSQTFVFHFSQLQQKW